MRIRLQSMGRMAGVAAAAGIALAGAPAWAQSEQEEYERDVSRVGGHEMGDNPRAMCLCVNGLEDNVVGYMIIGPGASGGSSGLTCVIPGFGAEGEVVGGFTCGDFLPMLR